MKKYSVMMNIGKSKYVISHSDGEKTYPDGSEFYDLTIKKNKKELFAFTKSLDNSGYRRI